MGHVELVREAASSLGLLDAEGRLVDLDSLTILDLVEKLETKGGITIPTASLRQEAFTSIESIANLLTELQAVGSGSQPAAR